MSGLFRLSGRPRNIPGPVTLDYQPLTLSAAAYSTVSKDGIPPKFSGSIVVLVAVSNADGTPRTGLSKEDFKIQLFGPSASPLASAQMQVNWLTPVYPSHAYMLAVFMVPESSWINGLYVLLVEVTTTSDGPIGTGRTITTARVSYQI